MVPNLTEQPIPNMLGFLEPSFFPLAARRGLHFHTPRNHDRMKMTSAKSRTTVTPLRAFLAECKPPFESSVHIVLGNEAADLDSISCAIVLAYLTQASSNLPKIPVANIPRADLPLRRDVLVALRLAEISPSNLLFIDELPDGLTSSGALTLVDHNALARHQIGAAPHVSAVIDHHADEGQHMNANPRIVEKVGSCSTLVADLIDGTEMTNQRDAARLLSCAILLDTSNLKDMAKTTPRDEQALARLREIAEWDEKTMSEVHGVLKKARRDVLGMDARDLLRRDLKTVHAGGMDVAFASVGMRPEVLVNASGKEGFAGCVERFAEERGVSCVLVLVTNSIREGTQRHLAIMKGKLGDLLRLALCEDAEHSVGMDAAEIPGGEGVWWFKLKDGSMSRKIVAPKVTLALGVVAERLRREV